KENYMKKRQTVHRSTIKVEKSNGELKWHSFEEVFKKSAKNAIFSKAYNEEQLRLRLASQIRATRTKKRLTQKAVAERSGMPQSVIARIENGENGLTIDTLGKVAHALGKTIQLA
ncbi:MAG TPA: helix-turn-helix transcriptional regulator, partial [Candidatus Paceibacterota bacterium]